MHASVPRVAPLPESEWTDEVRQLLLANANDRPPLNIFKTLARHPKLLKRWMVFGTHVLRKSTLPARERELAILRTGWLCRSEYEFHQHTRIALQCGVTEDEIRRLVRDASEWTGPDAVLIRAVDELLANKRIDDATWQQLSQHWSEQQRIDLVFAVGQYTLVSMALNTFGVQTEDGSRGFPA